MKKRMISLLLVLVTLLGILPVTSFAAPTLEEAMAEVDIYARNETLDWLTMNGSVKEQHYTYYKYESVQTGQLKEIPAYCVDPRLYGVPALVPEGTPIKYTAPDTVSDPKVCGIIANGYPHESLSVLKVNTPEEAYYATKTALWIYLLGKPEIIPEEARVIRQIYDAYLSGKSLQDIKRMLEDEGIVTKTGLTVWSMGAIQNILRNEKYAGDALLQKTYTIDPISGTRKKNEGELAQYLVKNCHPAIIPRETFVLVQDEMTRRTTARTPEKLPEPPQEKVIYSSKYTLSEVLICGACNSPYRRCTWKRNGKTRIVWRCQNRLSNGRKYCTNSPTIQESELHQALVAAINRMLHQKEYLLQPFEAADIAARYQNLVEQQKQIDDTVINLIAQYAERQDWDGDIEPFRILINKRRRFSPSRYPEQLPLPHRLETYDDGIARRVLEKVKIIDGEHLLVTFKGGIEMEQMF